MQEVYLHLGLQKTATTLFQLEIFPKLQGIYFYNKPKIKRVLEEPIAGDKILLSEEGWSHTFTPRGKLPAPSEIDYEFSLLGKLHARFPRAKIILGIREKESWVKSLFSRFYLETQDDDFEKFRTEINPKFLNQFRYIRQILLLFDEVFIYDYDNFLSNKQKVIENMCAFMGVSVPIDIDTDKRYNVSLFSWEKGRCKRRN